MQYVATECPRCHEAATVPDIALTIVCPGCGITFTREEEAEPLPGMIDWRNINNLKDLVEA